MTKRIHDTFSLFEQAGALIGDADIRIPEDFMEIGTKTIMMSKDRLAVLGEMTAEKMGLLNPATRKMMGITHAGAAPTTKEEKIEALRERKNLKLWADGIFETYDLLCTPTLNIISPLRPEDPFEMPYPYQAYRETSSSAFTSFANILGLTAISIPAGFVNGMPVGLQILANRFNDELVFRAARAIEKLAPWHDTHQPQFL